MNSHHAPRHHLVILSCLLRLGAQRWLGFRFGQVGMLYWFKWWIIIILGSRRGGQWWKKSDNASELLQDLLAPGMAQTIPSMSAKKITVIKLVNEESSDSDLVSSDMSAFEARPFKKAKKEQKLTKKAKEWQRRHILIQLHHQHWWHMQRKCLKGKLYLTLINSRSLSWIPSCLHLAAADETERGQQGIKRASVAHCMHGVWFYQEGTWKTKSLEIMLSSRLYDDDDGNRCQATCTCNHIFLQQ